LNTGFLGLVQAEGEIDEISVHEEKVEGERRE